MTDVHELRQNERREQGVSATAVRMFRVWTPSPKAALEAVGVPAEGAEHPDDASLNVASRFAVRETDHGACLVTVNYQRQAFADGGGDLQVFDTINQPGRVSIDLAADVVASSYPVLRPREVVPVTATPTDPPLPPKRAWAAVDASGTRVRTTLTIRTAFAMEYTPSLQGLFAAFRPVTQQTNRLHQVGADLYLFACRTINQATESDGVTAQTELWNAEYSWTHDPGIPVPGTLPDGWQTYPGDAVGTADVRLPNLVLPAPVADIDPDIAQPRRYVVPPYSDVLHGVLELPDASLDNPEFIAKLNHTIDLQGYNVLPGVAG